jgi:hypothetical protein
LGSRRPRRRSNASSSKAALHSISIRQSPTGHGAPAARVVVLVRRSTAETTDSYLPHLGEPWHFRRPPHRTAVAVCLALYDVGPIDMRIGLNHGQGARALVSPKHRDRHGIVGAEQERDRASVEHGTNLGRDRLPVGRAVFRGSLHESALSVRHLKSTKNTGDRFLALPSGEAMLRRMAVVDANNDHVRAPAQVAADRIVRGLVAEHPAAAVIIDHDWVRPRTRWLIGAYAGVSSAMRPSLQPYLASKSAFTVAAS